MPGHCAPACAPRWGSTSAAVRRSPLRSRLSARFMRCSPAAVDVRSRKLRIEIRPVSELLPLIGILAASGVIAGFAAGLLGVGGGIVTVPVLEYSLRFAHVPEEWRMHIAVATSLAAIIPTSISSARTHHARGAVDGALAKSWGLPVFLGAGIGSVLAARAPLAVLAGIFGSVALLIALKMLLPLDHVRVAQAPPRGIGGIALA